jgi:hypothetical protein
VSPRLPSRVAEIAEDLPALQEKARRQLPVPPAQDEIPASPPPEDDLSGYELTEYLPEAAALPRPLKPEPVAPPGGRPILIGIAIGTILLVIATGVLLLVRQVRTPARHDAGETALDLPDLATSPTTSPTTAPVPIPTAIPGTEPKVEAKAAGEPAGDPRLSAVNPQAGTTRVIVKLGQLFEFRVEARGGGPGSHAPRWRLNDELVAEGNAYFFRPTSPGRNLVSVSFGDEASGKAKSLIWYVDVK